MIYLVSKTINTDDMENVESLSVEDSLDLISSWPVVQLDTETTGLNCHVCSLTSIQFGYYDFKTGEHTEIVVDCNSIDPKQYKDVIEKSYLIGHNLAFDLKYLYNYGITPLKVYDTMVVEQLLHLGYKPGSVSMKLGDVLLRRVGIELDKSFQKEIASKGLTKEGIIYAAHDVVYLQSIRKIQLEIAKGRKCEKAVIVENRFVPAVAYLEWCGVHLDVDRWKEKMVSDATELADYEQKLNEYVKSNTKLNTKFVSSYTQPSLFDTDGSSYIPQCTVDWNSSRQVVPVLQELGFNTKTLDKQTKKEKDTALESVIANQKGIADEFLDLYFGYKGAEKNVSSYGQGHLNLINPNTGRLHTVFHQFGTVTGRMSSGSSAKDKDLARFKHLPEYEVRFVNLQNLPARGDAGKICRACFTAQKGNVFVSCDYSAEESRVQADVWNEKKLLNSFEHGIDTHNLYAKMCYPEELKDVDVKDVKNVRPDLRQNAKFFEFELAYGGNGSQTAKKLGLNKEKAMQNVANVLKEMPGMVSFKKKTGKFLKENGYIIINPITGHRVYWPKWAEWKATEDRFDRQFWTDYSMYHKDTNDSVAQMVRHHMVQGHDWFAKNVLNYPIQGGSAIVLKQAAADLFEWIVKNGYFNKILFCVFVHDEIDAECPKELAEMFSKKLEEIMEKAAAKYYKRLKIPADCQISDHWVH